MDSSMQSNTPAVPSSAAGLDPSADQVMTAAAEAAEPLDAILRQIIGGYFVLTDGQGSVSKWSEPAELLFGRPAAEVLGQSFFQTLIQSPAPAAAESWRRLPGDRRGAAGAVGRVEVTALHAEGTTFAMETVFVPVKLDEGFDFSLFLEDLGFELPMNLMLQRMRAQHPIVVRALRQALEPDPQPWEGWRTAGTLVVFRPLAPTPWVEAELAARDAARAEADADVEERLTNLDPGVQGSVADLDDAAAVVARLLSAMERIDELERVALSLPGQLEEARQAAERRAEAAEREAQALRAEIQRALTDGAARRGRRRRDPAPASCSPVWSASSAPGWTPSRPRTTAAARSTSPRPRAPSSPPASTASSSSARSPPPPPTPAWRPRSPRPSAAPRRRSSKPAAAPTRRAPTSRRGWPRSRAAAPAPATSASPI